MSTNKREKKPVEVVVFEDPAKRSKKHLAKTAVQPSTSSNAAKETIVRPEYDQKKAKYDIRKLAIKGMDKSEKEIAMADFLVELGAKKPRSKHVNIKEFMAEAKKRRLEEGDQEENQPQDDDPAKKPKYKRRRDKDDILGSVDGQIGTYKRGVQFINRTKSAPRKKKF